MDQFTEITSQGWGSRLKDSIKGIVIGLALFIGAFPLTWWNEGRAVKQTRSLEEGAGVVVQADAARVDAANEGKLVHLAGTVEALGALSDEQFGISVAALGLKRNVQMYQWHEEEKTEKRKQLGGGSETVTTYSYEKSWDEDPVDSSDFRHSEGHVNPTTFPIQAQRTDAESAKLGAYTLDQDIVRRLEHWQDLRPSSEASVAPPGFVRSGDGFYGGENPSAPKVGDVRVSFEHVPSGPFSFIARQLGNGLGQYATQAGNPILMVETGLHPAAEMFKNAHSANNKVTWLLRVVGFILMTVGLGMLLRPLSVVLDVIPLLGNVAEMGITLVAGLLALVFSSVTIALAWLWYRPLIGVAMLVAAVAGLFLLRQRRVTAPGRVPAAPPPVGAMPPPPPPL